MKLIHCADLHLDSKMESNLSGEKAGERREELLACFAFMVDYAKEHSVQAIIIAGDLFDTSADSQKRIKNRVLDQIRCAQEIDFLYLRGNHDRVDFFDKLMDKPKNLKTFTDTWTTYTYGNISITGCELHKGTPANIYSSLILDKNQINIVVLHGQESHVDRPFTADNPEHNENNSFSSSASKTVNAEIIPLAALQNRFIDYLALGHIHSYKYAGLDSRGAYCYSGCLEGRGFDECGQKGFVLLDISGGKVSHSFIPASRRIFHELPVILSGCPGENDILEGIEKAVSSLPPKDLVKIILEGEIEAETDIDLKYLQRYFNNRFYFVKIYDQTRLMLRQEDYAKDISLKGEFIRMVQEQDLKENEKNTIIMLGLKALAGREIDL